MPGKSLKKNVSRTVEAITLEGHANAHQSERQERRNSLVNKTANVGDIAAQMEANKKKQAKVKDQHERDILAEKQEIVQNINNTTENSFNKAVPRLDDYRDSSDRNFELVNLLDSYLKRLDSTGKSGSPTFMNAKMSIIEYKKMILKIDGNPAVKDRAEELEAAFVKMQHEVGAAIESYNDRGIISEYRTGGKRRVIFMEIQKEMQVNVKDANANGRLYDSFAKDKAFEEKRESEIEEEKAKEEEQRKYFNDSTEELKNLILKYENEKDELKARQPERELNEEEEKAFREDIEKKCNEKNDQINMLRERLGAMANTYTRFLVSNSTLQTPPMTKLQKKEYAERIAKWKKIRSKCKQSATLKGPGDSLVRSFVGMRIDEIHENIEPLTDMVRDMENAGNVKNIESMKKMLTAMKALKKDFDSFMYDLGNHKAGFKKGTAAALEQSFQNAFEAVREVTALKLNDTNRDYIEKARSIKQSMKDGYLASIIGEMVIVSSIREGYLYESREDIEEPLSEKELNGLMKPISKKELKNLEGIAETLPSEKTLKKATAEKKKIKAKIDAGNLSEEERSRLWGEYSRLEDKESAATIEIERERAEKIKGWSPIKYVNMITRLYNKQIDYSDVDRKYNIEERSENKTIPQEALGASKDFLGELKYVNNICGSLLQAPSGCDLVEHMEFTTAFMRLRRRISRLFELELAKECQGKNLSSQEKYKLIYHMFMTTDIGKACCSMNCLISYINLMTFDDGLGNTLGQLGKIEDIDVVKDGIGLNLTNYILTMDHERDIKVDLSNMENLMTEKHVGKETMDEESRRVEGLVNKILGKKYTPQQLEALKGNNLIG